MDLNQRTSSNSEQLWPTGHGVFLVENTSVALDDGEKDNVHEFSSANYDSLRQFVERKNRELEDIREFADIERQTLKAQIQEQEIKIKSFSSGGRKVEKEVGIIGNFSANAVTTILEVGDIEFESIFAIVLTRSIF